MGQLACGVCAGGSCVKHDLAKVKKADDRGAMHPEVIAYVGLLSEPADVFPDQAHACPSPRQTQPEVTLRHKFLNYLCAIEHERIRQNSCEKALPGFSTILAEAKDGLSWRGINVLLFDVRKLPL